MEKYFTCAVALDCTATPLLAMWICSRELTWIVQYLTEYNLCVNTAIVHALHAEDLHRKQQHLFLAWELAVLGDVCRRCVLRVARNDEEHTAVAGKSERHVSRH